MSERRPERRAGDKQRHVSPPPGDVPAGMVSKRAGQSGAGRVAAWWRETRGVVVSVALAGVMFLLAAAAARGPEPGAAIDSLEAELRRTRSELTARQGELELARLELSRLSNIVSHSATHRIPADLAAAVYDIALSEGVDPVLAFSLIRVESGFTRRAVSSAGAVGYTQVMPSTAFWLQPGLGRDDLFERDTNLRLGFRYLRMMIEQYDGDLHLALLAYNRGPGRVDEILRAGGDPSNGYSLSVRSGLPGSSLRALRLRGD